MTTGSRIETHLCAQHFLATGTACLLPWLGMSNSAPWVGWGLWGSSEARPGIGSRIVRGRAHSRQRTAVVMTHVLNRPLYSDFWLTILPYSTTPGPSRTDATILWARSGPWAKMFDILGRDDLDHPLKTTTFTTDCPFGFCSSGKVPNF